MCYLALSLCDLRSFCFLQLSPLLNHTLMNILDFEYELSEDGFSLIDMEACRSWSQKQTEGTWEQLRKERTSAKSFSLKHLVR